MTKAISHQKSIRYPLPKMIHYLEPINPKYTSLMRRRAFLYITRDLPIGRGLLVFSQDDPAAGIQTPGGTIEPHEMVLEGALREALEETGLEGLVEPRQIAFDLFEHTSGKVECYHVHVRAVGDLPDAWVHTVSAGQDDQGMQFSCFWLSLEQAREKVWPHMVYVIEEIGADP